MPVGEVVLDLADQLRGFVENAFFEFRRQVFVGKIDGRLEMRENAGHTVAPAAIESAELTTQLTDCLAALCFGLGRDEVGDRLGLQQIELAIEKSAAGEFTGLGET